MQSLMESLCRCLGTATPPMPSDLHRTLSDPANKPTRRSVPGTPESKRRTRRLALKDEQWDALFEGNRKRPPRPSAAAYVTPSSRLSEEANELARTKQLATRKTPKRKRSCSPDEIFRSKKPEKIHQGKESAHPEGAPNPFSRFLSSHPGIAHSLCFATPIRGSHEEEENSVISDSHTLNSNAEDTITSTLYYEQVKLAGLTQTNPPMPLFKHYSLLGKEKVHQIAPPAMVSSSSSSSK